MKSISIYEPVSQEFINVVAKQLGLDPEKYKSHMHPQEDFLLKSEKYPIFVVADGVTLELDKDKNYPNPSGAGEAARIFCETIVSEAEKLYEGFIEENILEIFRKGNEAVGEWNVKNGRTKETINYRDFDLFAITTAFALIKENKVSWFSLCDSFFLILDKDGLIKFISPEPWELMIKNRPEDWKDIDPDERKKITRKDFRNGVNSKGEPIGYGVVTGEKNAELYLNKGVVEIEQGNIIAILTDGFEDYIELSEFISVLKDWPTDIEKRIHDLGRIKIKNDPNSFGHERSLIVVSI